MSDTDSGITEESEGPEIIDPNVALDMIADTTKPDEPEIDLPRDGQVHLLWGIEVDGIRYRTASVKELNGGDEEALARLDPSMWNHGIVQSDLVLRRATESIGPVNVADNPSLLLNLLIGDRDILFKEILLSTAGTVQEYKNVVCLKCQFEHDIEVDFENLLIDPKMPDGINPERISVELRNGIKVEFRWPTGKDQMAVYQGNVKLTQPEANTAMMTRCILTVGGQVEPDVKAWAQKLGVKDRQIVLAEMSKMPVVSFKEDEVPCTSCGAPLPVSFGWASLL